MGTLRMAKATLLQGRSNESETVLADIRKLYRSLQAVRPNDPQYLVLATKIQELSAQYRSFVDLEDARARDRPDTPDPAKGRS